jgi:hypothetical protein
MPAGDVAGETETKSGSGENGEVVVNVNCNGESVDRHSHGVYNNGFLP